VSTHFIILTRTIWPNIDLGPETYYAKTKASAFQDRDVDTFSRDETLVHLETLRSQPASNTFCG